ncbi:hypothetical protein [Microbulbifer sp. 2205BS26-8]|uniref:hypothetical protein n=1 Tax=Microbulbifer sp. 2205BS26-8 TaxID=3064386 RepID=UPI00273F1B5B|nr:hypothetical protein [Microbulbifer sp. 2205BS26-8]MDP5210680.1 hypothetical protein [Microbulbifer sp. 2205BS26-8]
MDAVIEKIALGVKPSLLRKILRHRYLEHYNLLFLLVFAVNAGIFWYGFTQADWWSKQGDSLPVLLDLILANFAVAILVRQQYVINLFFWIATRAPVSWPLWIRWHLAKVYHFGGLHSGGTVGGTLWYAIYLTVLVYQQDDPLPNTSKNLVIVSFLLMAVLVLIVTMALPLVRRRFHNQFEWVHRFGGWLILILFWIQTCLLVNGISDLIQSPSFWGLCIITFSVILPWLRLKKVKIDIDSPSSHVALTRFDHGVTPFAGSSTAISRNPLLEWHSFANVPAPGEDGFRLTISRAGDWTGRFIDDRPKQVWTKGIPTAGVANIEVLFKKVVYIATGSGIGPCLPHLLAKKVPASLVWSARNPRKTYGNMLVDEVLDAVPDALIWDTSSHGKPDLVKLALNTVLKTGAEAVICIANQPLTQKVVYEIELRGIPAYGAIWDS